MEAHWKEVHSEAASTLDPTIGCSEDSLVGYAPAGRTRNILYPLYFVGSEGNLAEHVRVDRR